MIKDRKACLFKLPKETRDQLAQRAEEGSCSMTDVVIRAVSDPSPEPMPDQVYVMKNTRNGLFKIGCSKRPKFRERTLQSQEPEIVLLSATPASKSVERAIHQIFYSKRVRGEWFSLTEEEAQSVADLVMKEMDRFIPTEIADSSTTVGTRVKSAPWVFCAYRLPVWVPDLIERLASERNCRKGDVIIQAMEQLAHPLIKMGPPVVVRITPDAKINVTIDKPAKRAPRHTRAPLLKRGGTIL